MDLGFKFYLAGPNASMLSRELGTHLTGRYVPIELFPFSFFEFIQFRIEAFPDLRHLTGGDKVRLKNLLDAYLRFGGIPEALKFPESPVLRDLYDAILYRDIAASHHLEKVTALRELAFYLLTHPAGLISLDQLKRQLHLGSTKTIQDHLSYLENSWLVFTLDVYAPSLKLQPFGHKKIYCIDTGLATVVGFSPVPLNLLENLVFVALRRQTKELSACLLPGGSAASFYLPERGQVLQISTDWGSSATREHEVQALSATLKTARVENALILSEAEQDSFELDGLQVEVRAISEWLASQ